MAGTIPTVRSGTLTHAEINCLTGLARGNAQTLSGGITCNNQPQPKPRRLQKEEFDSITRLAQHVFEVPRRVVVVALSVKDPREISRARPSREFDHCRSCGRWTCASYPSSTRSASGSCRSRRGRLSMPRVPPPSVSPVLSVHHSYLIWSYLKMS